MTAFVPPYAPSLQDWQRQVSNAVNPALVKLGNTADLKADFGAIGDGSTPDTNAFLKGVQSGTELFLPPGNFVIDPCAFSNLSSHKVRGSGRDVTRITLRSSGTGLTLSNCQWGHWSDFSIQAQGTAQSLANCSGIQADTGSGNCIFERINFYGFSLDGLRLAGAVGNQMSGHVVRQCYFLGNGRNQIYGNYSNDFTFEDNQFGMLAGVPHAQFGVYLDTCSEGTYSENKHWNNAVGMQAVNCNANRYIGNRWEESDKQGIQVNGGNFNLFDGNTIHTNSLLGNGLYDYAYFTNSTQLTFVGNEVRSWNATYGRVGVNFDVGCDDINLGKNIVRGFDATNYGPWRFDGSISRVDGDALFEFNGAAVAAGATVFMGSPGANANESAVNRPMNRRFAVARMYVATDSAPGAGLSYTYTLRKNGADTAMTAASTGASSFAAAANNSAPEIIFDTGDSIAMKVVTSAGAAVANHRGYVVLVEY